MGALRGRIRETSKNVEDNRWKERFEKDIICVCGLKLDVEGHILVY